jgi:nucleotide-binding universal stress UspA family protein
MNESEQSREGDWPPKTIVVSYDGTSAAERSIDRAIELARAFRSRVVVADVAALVPAPLDLDPTPGAFGYTPYYYAETLENEVRTDEVVRQQHRSHIETLFAQSGIEHEFADVGEDVAEIVEVAEQHDADVVVLGRHEPGFLERLLEGSVGESVARRAHCDVLIVHPPAE